MRMTGRSNVGNGTNKQQLDVGSADWTLLVPFRYSTPDLPFQNLIKVFAVFYLIRYRCAYLPRMSLAYVNMYMYTAYAISKYPQNGNSEFEQHIYCFQGEVDQWEDKVKSQKEELSQLETEKRGLEAILKKHAGVCKVVKLKGLHGIFKILYFTANLLQYLI